MPYPHQLIKLTKKERKGIELKLKDYAISGQYKKRRRLQAIWLSDQGLTFRQISQRLNVSYLTIQRWAALYRQDGLNAF